MHYEKPNPIDSEIILDPKRFIVSKTDATGKITYANDYFVEISGYTEEEMLGMPHNIIRHPDMPRVIFKIMWEQIKQGKNIRAIIKNLARDGRYYWVITDFECRYDTVLKQITQYTAYRSAAPKKAIDAIVPLYAKLCSIERHSGIKASEDYLNGFLAAKRCNYSQYIESIINEGAVSKMFGFAKKLFK